MLLHVKQSYGLPKFCGIRNKHLHLSVFLCIERQTPLRRVSPPLAKDRADIRDFLFVSRAGLHKIHLVKMSAQKLCCYAAHSQIIFAVNFSTNSLPILSANIKTLLRTSISFIYSMSSGIMFVLCTATLKLWSSCSGLMRLTVE